MANYARDGQAFLGARLGGGGCFVRPGGHAAGRPGVEVCWRSRKRRGYGALRKGRVRDGGG